VVLYHRSSICHHGVHGHNFIVTFTHRMAVVFSVLHFWTKEYAEGTTRGRVWLHRATEGQMRNSVKCKALFIGFARLRYLWKVMASRKHDNVGSLKFRRQTYVSVCVLPFRSRGENANVIK